MPDFLRFRAMSCVVLLLIATPTLAAFIPNPDGTVSDDETGLVWDQCSWGQTGSDCAGGSAGLHDWADALAVALTANGANHKGHDDWRLPNRTELESLVDRSVATPAIDVGVFPNTVATWYWSSTTYAVDPTNAWAIFLDDGNTFAVSKGSNNHVRLVRGGQSLGAYDAQATAGAPTLSQWATILLVLLLAGIGFLRVRETGSGCRA